MNESVLVTGGAGFIGSHIVDYLIKKGNDVFVVDDLSRGKQENINGLAQFYELELDASAADILEERLPWDQIDIIIHQAAQIDVGSSLEEPVFDAQNNILNTIALLELARKHGVRKFIYASSAAVYGDPDSSLLPLAETVEVYPLSPYGISKHTVEHYLKVYQDQYGLEYNVLRYSNVYGPRQDAKGEGGVVSIFIDRIIEGKPPVIHGDGQQTRDFISVFDIARANYQAMVAEASGIYNISTATEVSVNQLYEILCDVSGLELEPIQEPPRPGDIKRSSLDNSRAIADLGWEPEVELREGLLKTHEFYA